MITNIEKRVAALVLAATMCMSTLFTGIMSVNAEDLALDNVQEVTVGVQNTTEIEGTEKQELYRFVPEETGKYRFYATGTEDTYGYVYDAENNLLASGNDGEADLNFDITVDMEAGQEYYLVADYFLDNVTGTIAWCIERMEDTDAESELVVEVSAQPEQSEVQADLENTDFIYTVKDGSVEITGYKGSAAEVVIPDKIDGKKVISVGEAAFKQNKEITKMTIPGTVTSLQYESFSGCTNLTEVVVPKSGELLTIAEQSFYSCSKLKSFDMPDKTETIGKWAFYSCGDLTTVLFGEKVKSIGFQAFVDSGLTSVSLPDSVTNVGDGVFSMCKKLASVKIGSGLDAIAASMFSGASALKHIDIPSTINEIGEGAFSYCGLTELHIPDSVSKLGESAFSGCRSLKKVTGGKSLEELPNQVFGGCDIESIELSENLKQLGMYALWGNEHLRKISLPKNVTTIEYRAFTGCSELGNVTFPEKLSRLGGKILDGTKWYEQQPDGLVYAGNVLYEYKGEMPEHLKLELPKNTVGIGGFAFDECANLESVVIPDGVENIMHFAFFDCTSLKSISIPNSVTEIGMYALGCYRPQSGGKDIVDNDWTSIQKYDLVPGFEIRGEAQSAAEAYAKQYGIKFVKNTHTVKFMDGDKLISEQKIISGENANPPKISKEGYMLKGWTGDYKNVKQDLTLNAIWGRADGWVYTTEGWYYYENGKKVTGWKEIKGVWYYLKSDGLMASDEWIGDYYVNKSGAWVKHYRPAQWVKSNGKWWYREVDGSYPVNCWKKISGKWYYFDSYGYSVTGWKYLGGTWYYLDASGAMATGWVSTGGRWYYMNKDGSMSTGWVYAGNRWYYMNQDGSMSTGWIYKGGKWYYLDKSGAMATDWVSIGGRWYYMNKDGSMSTGWVYAGNRWYYMNQDGSMSTGWIYKGGKWYYLDKSGAMATDWVSIGGRWYYMNKDGSMSTGWIFTGGHWYYMNSNGSMATSKWVGNYYVQSDGTMAVNQWIGDYYVGEDGCWIPDAKSMFMEKEVASLVNTARSEKGKTSLTYDKELSKAAETRAKELQKKFSHDRPDGTNCFTVLDEYDISYMAVGENIAAGQRSAKEVMTSWMNSAGHYANIVGDYTHIGVGHYKGSDGVDYWVQLFIKK